MDLKKILRQNYKYLNMHLPDPDVIGRQFAETDTRSCITAGLINIPSGKIVIGDPLSYICQKDFCPVFIRTVAEGKYPVELAYTESSVAGIRISAARIKFNEKPAVRYEPALADFSDLPKDSDGFFDGFPVYGGMLAFISEEGAEKYGEFVRKWQEENVHKKLYDDYFAPILAENAGDLIYDEEWEGDFANWTIPDTDLNMVMAVSGFGNGFYRAFWGRDRDGGLCELTVPMINSDIIDNAESDYLKIWDGAEYCIVTNRIAVDGCKVGYMYRDIPSETFSDSGWRFYEGSENGAYMGNFNNISIMSIYKVAEKNPEIIPFLHMDTETALYRNENGYFENDVNLLNSW
ncbi:MAG: DUF2185 domain-containing protein [Ruminococcus sp.]|nr:DUF2185 domain-containing protein [Ruminococcus sp.]